MAVTGKENSDGYRCGLETWYREPEDETWMPWQCLLTEKPGWVRELLPGNKDAYWAPEFLSERVMVYSVSSGFDDGAMQAIGMLTASGSPPDLEWMDSGSPISISYDPERNT